MRSADAACDSVLHALGRAGDQDDDTAVLALLLDHASATGRLRRWLPAHPQAAGAARRGLRELLTAAGLDADTAELLVSELVGNAVRYAPRHDLLLRARLTDGLLRVEVQDSSPTLPRLPEQASEEAESGRGLLLVDRLAERWGADATPGGKRLWFELSPPPAP